MKAEFYKEQIATLLSMVKAGKGDEHDAVDVLAANDYLDPSRLAQEKQLFKRLPLMLAHSSELSNAGAIDELVLAKNEHMLKVFADTIDGYLAKQKIN